MLLSRQSRVDDARLAKCAPAGVVLPRSAVANLLSEALAARAQARTTRNQVDLEGGELKLTLSFGTDFSPVYAFPITSLAAPEPGHKQADVAELEAQVTALMLQIRKLTAMAAMN